MTNTVYNIAKTMKAQYERNHEIACEVLKAVSGDERGPMGLTPDHIKQTVDWKVAFQSERIAFRAMADFNKWFSREFKKEIRNERNLARG